MTESEGFTFSEYQELANETAIYPYAAEGHIVGVSYVTLGLASEAGEVAGKVKKVLRDDFGQITEDKREEISKELGDVLWYLAVAATELGYDLSYLAQQNALKLKDRKDRGVLGGSGDER